MPVDLTPQHPAPVARGTLADRTRLPELVRAQGRRTALVAPDGSHVDGDELADRIEDLRAQLGPTRRLVVVRARNDVDSVVAELAALSGHHAVLLTAAPADPAVVGVDGADPAAELLARYRPDAVLDAGVLEELRPGSAHDLHPDLALLLSTSGSTGSPKCVRLSWDAVASNAVAIADYLRLGPDDVAATTLPLHYCYGLSVLHSHLLAAGGTVALGSWSVVDPCCWERCREVGATSLAGVPHTFELLDRIGFTGDELPTLRRLTQAGGRLAPDAVRRYSALGRRHGWDLVVMYGQTEATARMAYLPPDLAEAHPDAIGVAIPGGELTLDPVPGAAPGVGEIVYRGPNVMLGYATGPDDLALGRVTHELRTGDLGEHVGDGLLRVVGRRSRFVKPLGVRVDLDRLEAALADAVPGHGVRCTGDDGGVVVGVHGEHGEPDATTLAALRARAALRSGLPAAAITVVGCAELPRLPSGKPDDAALRARAAEQSDPGPAGPTGTGTDVAGVLAQLLGARPGPQDTFVGLGGDSLSYVEASVRLERLLGPLPPDWHQRSIAELESLAAARCGTVERLGTRRSGGRQFGGRRFGGQRFGGQRFGGIAWRPTDVVLRAVAVVAVVSFHTRLIPQALGGAHLLLAVAGYNFARFSLAGTDRPGHLRRRWASIARIAVPSVVFAAAIYLLSDGATLANLLLVNNYVSGGQIKYWYVEVLLQLLVLAALAFAVPAVRRAEAAHPWRFALAAVGVALLVGAAPDDWVGHPAIPIFVTHVVAWLFVLGWAVERADRTARRLVVSALAVAFVPSLFDELLRGLVVCAGVLVLIWVPRLPVPRVADRALSLVAAASLWIYLTHWHVFPRVSELVSPAAAVVASLVVGVAAWAAWERLAALTARAGRARRSGREGPATADARRWRPALVAQSDRATAS